MFRQKLNKIRIIISSMFVGNLFLSLLHGFNFLRFYLLNSLNMHGFVMHIQAFLGKIRWSKKSYVKPKN
jgi:hypothetical protein